MKTPRVLLAAASLMMLNHLDARALTYPIVDTGQTKFYNAGAQIAAPGIGQPFYGEDARFNGAVRQFQAPPECRSLRGVDSPQESLQSIQAHCRFWLRSMPISPGAPARSDRVSAFAHDGRRSLGRALRRWNCVSGIPERNELITGGTAP